jgi:hypothetical protein
MNRREFHVVAIDDKPEVCQSIKRKLEEVWAERDCPRVTVIVHAVSVKLKREGIDVDPLGDEWTFDDDMLPALSESCLVRPDVVFVDYTYMDQKVGDALKAAAASGQGGLTKGMMQGRERMPADLRDWVENHKLLPRGDRKRILKNLFDTPCPVYMHSYTPEGTECVVGPVEDRLKRTSLAFPNAELHLIDTRSLLFNNGEFDWPKPKTQRYYTKEYYPYQVAVVFSLMVHKEILRRELIARQHLRILWTGLASAGLATVLAAVGRVFSGFGNRMADSLFNSQNWVTSALAGGIVFVVLMFLGYLAILALEKAGRRLRGEASYK